MQSFRKLHIAKLFLLPVLAMPLLTSCHDYEAEAIHVGGDNQYVNFSIAISTGSPSVTRAGETPAGGENGDGREAGFYRENEVTGVTLFFYEAANGINSDASTTIAYTAYYSVSATNVKRDAAGTTETNITNDNRTGNTPDEYVFTTGDRLLDKTIDVNKTYHIIAVLNADLSKESLTTLGAVRDYKFSKLYDGTGDVESCTNFIMTSEQDFTMQLSSMTPTRQDDGDHYNITNPLRVERLAARIDFLAETGTGKICQGYNSTYNGYEYNVGSTDKFVVTAITPFNVYTKGSTNGGEYLTKRLTDDITGSNIKYIVDEEAGASSTNKYCYVLDPETANKESGATLDNYVNTLKGTSWLNGNLATSFSGKAVSAYPYLTIASMHEKLHTDGGSDTHTGGLSKTNSDILIVGYPMENTLGPNANLYDYATGLAIEGTYYQGGFSGTQISQTFYGFLRHQGESADTYATYPMTTDITTLQALKCATGFPMNYSIVRNNIYRVSVESITPQTSGDINLNIKVKKWDMFTHDPIYM